MRHAQGVHNVEGEKNHDAYLSEDLFDAHLTPLGWQQVSSCSFMGFVTRILHRNMNDMLNNAIVG